MPDKRTGTVALFGEVLADVFPDRRVLGGAPFNVARHLQAFGLHPVLITRTGNDVLRDDLIATMTGLGMDTLGVQSDPVHPTGQVQVHMENGGHRFEILSEQAYDYIHASVTHMVALAVQPELVYFGTLAQRHLISRRALGSLLRSVAVPRMLDINLRAPWYDVTTLKRSLAQADILKLNSEELAQIVRLLRLGARDEVQQAAVLLAQFHLSNVLVTCGKEGAWLLDDEGNIISLPAGEDIPVKDTVGAGDGFTSVFILGLFKNWSPEQILLRADRFARALCGIRGAIPPSDAFYAPFRKAWGLNKG
ncbi:carbohydrate kinase [Sulfuriferula sp. AH1]|nr:carbohydrate kinase [Sulfuriferula sp. AH1]ARU32928.1 carbohydrate kinase [Sulfuriferula sp. AH1]